MPINEGKIKVLIAAGGTGGHVFPGIAIAEEIRRTHPNARVVFAGTTDGFEAPVIRAQGLEMRVVGAKSRVEHTLAARVFKWASLPIATVRALAVLCAERPSLLVSIGGMAAAPTALAATLTRVPFVIVEPNAIAGFTNRVLGRFCRRAFVQFPEAASFFPKGKAVATGEPIRPEIASLGHKNLATEGPPTVFVFGGSQGARRLNEAMTEAIKFLGDLKDKLKIIHQTGGNEDHEVIRQKYAEGGFSAEAFPFTNEIWKCYAKSDFVIARAGGGTIAELAALAIPSILVPYPYAADDHQRANAECVRKIGGALMIKDEECTGRRLAGEIRLLIERPDLLTAMRAALKQFGKPDAAKKIVEEGWKLIS